MSSSISDEVLYSYAGLPSHWANVKLEDLEVSSIRWEKIESALLNLPDTPTVIYVEGEASMLVKLWLKTHKISDFLGINFIDYMKDVFNTPDFTPKKFTIIYNVGLERALKTDFSSRILKGFIQDAENQGCHTIIQGTQSITDFKKAYNIFDINSVKLTKKPKEKIL